MWSVSGRAGPRAVSPFQGRRLALLSGLLCTWPAGSREKHAGGPVVAQSGAPRTVEATGTGALSDRPWDLSKGVLRSECGKATRRFLAVLAQALGSERQCGRRGRGTALLTAARLCQPVDASTERRLEG